MEQTLEHKRKGFTLLEEAIVIAVIALLAIPLVTLLNQSIHAQIYGTKDIKGQYYANIILQDFERMIRQASSGSITINSSNPYKITFSYMKTDKNGTNPQSVTLNYELDNPNTTNALFYKWQDSEQKSVFPLGLEKGVIQDFEITNSKLDTSQSPPYYITVEIKTETGLTLKKTIYLVNYYKEE